MDAPSDLPPITPDKTPKSTRHFLYGILIGAGLVALGGLAALIILNNNSQSTTTNTTVSITPSPTPTPTREATNAAVSNPMSTWKTYTSSSQGFSLKYPPTWTLTTATSGSTEFGTPTLMAIRFSFIGPDQKEGTELADGITISLGVLNKPSTTKLNDFAEQTVKVDTEVASKEPTQEVIVGGKSGVKIVVNGLGTQENYFLPFGNMSDKAFWISKMANGKNVVDYNSSFNLLLESLVVN